MGNRRGWIVAEQSTTTIYIPSIFHDEITKNKKLHSFFFNCLLHRFNIFFRLIDLIP